MPSCGDTKLQHRDRCPEEPKPGTEPSRVTEIRFPVRAVNRPSAFMAMPNLDPEPQSFARFITLGVCEHPD